MRTFTRRTALQSLGASVLGMSLTRVALSGTDGLISDDELARWIQELQRNASRLRGHQISPLQWQEAMGSIYASTPLEGLRKHMDFESLSKNILENMPADRNELFHRIELQSPRIGSQADQPDPRQVLITKVAGIRKGHSVPPHGHSNMVSAFLCLSGEFEVRQYDRLDDREHQMVIRSSTHDKAAGAGTWSSISDYRDNVHWLTAKTDDCFLFTCKMLSVEPALPLRGRINIDVRRAKKIGCDTFIAKKITSAEASELY